MTRGLNRRQMGLTEAMVEAYGDTVWELSHNIQVRIGDPVRMLDWEQIERQRPGTGMSDGQIAEKIGLTRDQVTHIRLLLEHRRFQRDHYHRLYKLGGGKRYRPDRRDGPEDRQPLSDQAMALREALDFDPREADRYLRTGLWAASTPASRLRALAADLGDRPALITAAGTLDYAALHADAERAACRMRQRGLGRGEVVAVEVGALAPLVLAYCAVSLAGAVLCVLPAGLGEKARRDCLTRASAVGLFADLAEGAPDEDAPAEPEPAPVASDPLAVLFAEPGTPRAVVHNSHTLLAGIDAVAAGYGLSADDRLAVGSGVDGAAALVAVNLALASGAALDDTGGRATVAFCADGAAPPSSADLRLVVATGREAAALEARLGTVPVCRACMSAEAQLMFTARPEDDAAVRHATVGMPNPAMSARVVADDGDVLAAGSEGALEIRGANLAPSYLGDDRANRTAFSGDRWLRTGLRCVIHPGGAVEPLDGIPAVQFRRSG